MVTRLLTYAFSLYNGVMPLGQCGMGSSASFKGNGMCLSTRGLHGFLGDVTGWLRIWSIPEPMHFAGGGSSSSPGLRFTA